MSSDGRLWALMCGHFGDSLRDHVLSYVGDSVLHTVLRMPPTVDTAELQQALSTLKTQRHRQSVKYAYFNRPLSHTFRQRMDVFRLSTLCFNCRHLMKAAALHDPCTTDACSCKNDEKIDPPPGVTQVCMWLLEGFDSEKCYSCNADTLGYISTRQARDVMEVYIGKSCRLPCPHVLPLYHIFQLSMFNRLWCSKTAVETVARVIKSQGLWSGAGNCQNCARKLKHALDQEPERPTKKHKA